MPDLMTVAEVAERYGLERHSAADLMKKNMPVTRIGGKLFVRKRDLLAYEESRTEYPVPALVGRRRKRA